MPVESLSVHKSPNLAFRGIITADLEKIQQILEWAGNFRPQEIRTALEMAQQTLVTPGPLDYEYLIAVNERNYLVGFACFGAASMTRATFDLFWLVVHRQYQGSGVGKALLSRVVQILRDRAAWLLMVETSSLPSYIPAQKLYESMGFIKMAVINDFYDIGDHKIIYGLYLQLDHTTPALEGVPIKGGAQE